jgi:methionine-rich copper-binding protein CopC
MEYQKISRLRFIALLLLVLVGIPGTLWAHAFPDHSEPRVGSTVSASPKTVSIWFDGYLEPAFSTIEVYSELPAGIHQDENDASRRVDKNNGHVDDKNRTLLTVGVPALPPGKYRVVWAVVAVDGHRTEGDFTFKVEAPS